MKTNELLKLLKKNVVLLSATEAIMIFGIAL